jgi:hypothetical protein
MQKNKIEKNGSSCVVINLSSKLGHYQRDDHLRERNGEKEKSQGRSKKKQANKSEIQSIYHPTSQIGREG